jgi:hypothetical protein
VLPQLQGAALPAAHSNGQRLGAGVERKNFHGLIIEPLDRALDNRCMTFPRVLASLLGLTLLTAQAFAQALPPEVEAALARAKIPRDAVTLLVADVDGKLAPRLAHRTGVPVNPASVMKLVTTFAGLELLGPAYVWQTPVYIDGTVHDGTLRGNVLSARPRRSQTGDGAAVAAAAPLARPGH